MPDAGVPTEAQPQTEITVGKRFTPEHKAALEKAGFEVYELKGRTYEEIIQAYPTISFSRDFERYGKGTGGDELMDFLDAMKSRKTEVAIPRGARFLVPDSNLSQERQREIIDAMSDEIARNIPGTKRIMGNALDYVELGAEYAERTHGGSLFGNWANRQQATTESGLYVGSMPATKSEPAQVHISHMRGGLNNEGPLAAPLVVPA